MGAKVVFAHKPIEHPPRSSSDNEPFDTAVHGNERECHELGGPENDLQFEGKSRVIWLVDVAGVVLDHFDPEDQINDSIKHTHLFSLRYARTCAPKSGHPVGL